MVRQREWQEQKMLSMLFDFPIQAAAEFQNSEWLDSLILADIYIILFTLTPSLGH